MKLTDEVCNEMLSKQDVETKRMLVYIVHELNNAKEKHPEWPENVIERTAIVIEEAGELVKAALQYKCEKGCYYEMRREAIQTAAMALRFLLNMNL